MVRLENYYEMHPSLQETKHRPWPLPNGEWKWRQAWLNLAFIHFPVSSDALRMMLPSELRLQQYDGVAWVGLVPLRMSGVMRRPFPDLPPFSAFPELNLRTYVEADGKPGVWFFSLDAACWPIVFGGRTFYDLPYYSATMEDVVVGEWHNFRSVRKEGRARFRARYRPMGETYHALPGTFDHWATERYCLYSHSARKGLRRVEVHHAPWPLQRAEVHLEESTVLESAGIKAVGDPVCHFSSGVDVVSY